MYSTFFPCSFPPPKSLLTDRINKPGHTNEAICSNHLRLFVVDIEIIYLESYFTVIVQTAQLTCAVSVIPWPEQSAGLLVLSLSLSFVVAVIRESVYALVAARVAVRVVDDHVVRGDRQVDPQLITGQTTLGLGSFKCND